MEPNLIVRTILHTSIITDMLYISSLWILPHTPKYVQCLVILLSNNPNPYTPNPLPPTQHIHTYNFIQKKRNVFIPKNKLMGINVVLSCQAFRLGVGTNCLLINFMMSYDTSVHDDSGGSIMLQEVNIENDGMWYYCELNLMPILFSNVKALPHW